MLARTLILVGTLALFAGDDLSHPEVAKLAALRGAHVIAAPLALQEPWEQRYGLLNGR